MSKTKTKHEELNERNVYGGKNARKNKYSEKKVERL